MHNHMNVIRCEAVIVDRDAIAKRTFAQPLPVVVALPDRTEEKPAVVTPMRQVVRITCFKIARCVRHGVKIALKCLDVKSDLSFHR